MIIMIVIIVNDINNNNNNNFFVADDLTCPSSGSHYVEFSDCITSCNELSTPNRYCDIDNRWPGCVCQGDSYFNANGACIPVESCPCLDDIDGLTMYQPGSVRDTLCRTW